MNRQPRGLATFIGWLAMAVCAHGALARAVTATEITIYGFEDGLDGWAIPDWAKGSSDHVCQEIAVSQAQAQEGHSSLQLLTAFDGNGRWTGAYVERELEVTDWSPFGQLSASVYLPPGTPEGLEGKIILTVGEEWVWTEMNRGIPLRPGEWTTISVNLKPSSMDWKSFPDDRFRQNVRKLGVRVESNRQPAYVGPIYLDNVRLAE